MKFWRHLRWWASLAFLALLLWGWWAADDGGTADAPPRPHASHFNP